jgi:hypothetical protein
MYACFILSAQAIAGTGGSLRFCVKARMTLQETQLIVLMLAIELRLTTYTYCTCMHACAKCVYDLSPPYTGQSITTASVI